MAAERFNLDDDDLLREFWPAACIEDMSEAEGPDDEFVRCVYGSQDVDFDERLSQTWLKDCLSLLLLVLLRQAADYNAACLHMCYQRGWRWIRLQLYMPVRRPYMQRPWNTIEFKRFELPGLCDPDTGEGPFALNLWKPGLRRRLRCRYSGIYSTEYLGPPVRPTSRARWAWVEMEPLVADFYPLLMDRVRELAGIAGRRGNGKLLLRIRGREQAVPVESLRRGDVRIHLGQPRVKEVRPPPRDERTAG